MKNVIFIHINKTAGTSITQALKLPFSYHRTALQHRKSVGATQWIRSFKFCCIRNPWDKVVSHYYYRIKTNQTNLREEPINFSEWVIRSYGHKEKIYYDKPRMFMPQLDWISDKRGDILVDFICRFETLKEDFSLVCKKIGLTTDLPNLKSTNHPPYQDIYTDEARRIIGEHFRKDIAMFGYRF